MWDAFQEARDPRILTEWYFDWTPHRKQTQFLRALLFGGPQYQYDELYATTGARFGKSEMVGAGLLLYAMRCPGAGNIIGNISITLDQASLGWQKALDMATASRHFRHWFNPANTVLTPFPTMYLSNGAEIWARSTAYECKYLRGYSFRYLNYDEMAYGVEADMDVVPMRLADYGGPLSGTTTPRGKNWQWRQCWHPGEQEQTQAALERRQPRTFLLRGSSYDNPHIDHNFIQRKKMSERQRLQEVEGVYAEAEDKPWAADDVDAAVDTTLNPVLERWSRIGGESGRPDGSRYVHAWDLAKHGDYVVLVCLRVDCVPWRLEYYKRYRKKPWPQVERDIKREQARFDAWVIIDATGVGDSTWDHLDIPLHRCERFVFSNKSKGEVLENLAHVLEHRRVKIPFIKQLVDELTDYEWEDDDLVCDCVMAMAMACERARTLAPAGFVV